MSYSDNEDENIEDENIEDEIEEDIDQGEEKHDDEFLETYERRKIRLKYAYQRFKVPRHEHLNYGL